MNSTEGQGSGELLKVAELISDPGKRKAFAHDPEKALKDAGIDPGGLPEGVRSTLFDLSYEELRVLSRVRDSLSEAGVSSEMALRIF
jgi:hypothetical protein